MEDQFSHTVVFTVGKHVDNLATALNALQVNKGFRCPIFKASLPKVLVLYYGLPAYRGKGCLYHNTF